MKCPKCQFENPESAKFCGQCGSKIISLCPNCNSSNPPEFKFCGDCGQDLGWTSKKTPVDDIKADTLQPGLPFKTFLDKSGPGDGERKHVTVLFSDLSGYTALAEKLDPEDVKDIMSRIFGQIAQVIAKYEGFIERFIGDAVMAIFGVPKAHEDDPIRAIMAAREIHGLVENLSPKLEEQVGQPLSMHTGINTGLVVTGEVNLEGGTHGITGDALNVASRLEGLAVAGEILVGETTHRLAEGYFIFEPLELARIKGKEKPVKAYRLLGPSTKYTRLEVSAETGLTPLVGRKNEIEKLLDGFERSKVGNGQALTIVSEAGVGKSRLLYEFRQIVSGEDLNFLEGKCLSYNRAAAYHPFIDLLRSAFNIPEASTDLDVKELVITGLNSLDIDESSTLPYLLELLSVGASGVDIVQMGPEFMKEMIIRAIKQLILKTSEFKPLILAIEDLHWIDKSSEEIIKNLLGSLSGARVFLLLTYRPNFEPSWGPESYHNKLTLDRFSKDESLAMVSYVIGTKNIDWRLRDLILRKIAGVAFFIEEFIKSLIHLGVIERKDNYYYVKDVQDVTIPSTIQDVIMARVDCFPESSKELLQTGSVIEREFSYELLKRVSGLSNQELYTSLIPIKASGLIFEKGIFPQTTYGFKHTLTRDVVYNSLLIKRKKKLHLKIGNAIEELYSDSLADYYGSLIKHFMNGKNYGKGAEYCRLASKMAVKTASINEAIACGVKQVTCLEKLPKTEDIAKTLVKARTILGLHYMQLNYHVESKQAVESVIDLAISGSDKKRIAQIFIILGTYYYLVEENFPKALKYLKDALIISEELNDLVCESISAHWLGFGLAFNCEYDEALYYLEKALRFYEFAGIQWAISMVKTVMGYFLYFFQGKFNLVYEMNDQALRSTEKSGDLYSKSMAYSAVGLSCYCKGMFEEATQHYIKGADLCEKVNHFYSNALTHFNLGETYHQLQAYQKSKDHYCKAIWLMDQNRSFPFWIKLFRAGLARAKARNNEKDIDLESLYEYARDNKVNLYEGWISRYIGEILLYIGDNRFSDAEYWLNRALKADKTNGIMFHLGNDYASYAEFLKRKGDPIRAKENLYKAIDIFKECGADIWVKNAEKELMAFA